MTIFYKLLPSEPQMLWSSLDLFLKAFVEDTIITTNFLKSHICSTSRAEINTSFVTFNKKIGILPSETRSHASMYSRMDQVKIFKAFLPQILLGPFLSTLYHIILNRMEMLNGISFQVYML